MKVKSNTDTKNLIIKIIICISAFIVMMPYATLFGLPFFVIGLILLWNSKLTKIEKWKWSTLPIISVTIIYTIIGLVIYIFKL